ncbi:hypothetical protein [Proteus alimentorum]|uniref:hypothetical protein n=1 Tax=Proteus alimentorum TaxID=1973495 RepID=UPI000BFF89E2|nr:hypothetical protein [Proteus alimentorum]
MTSSDFLILLESFKKFMLDKGFSVIGCSDEQIFQLEDKYGKLPYFYKIYLSIFGLEAGDFKKGTDILYSELDDINIYSIELLEENDIRIPLNFFSFLLHQGYSSLFFIDRQCDDPDVYVYTEGDKIRKTKLKFSECLLAEIDYYKE